MPVAWAKEREIQDIGLAWYKKSFVFWAILFIVRFTLDALFALNCSKLGISIFCCFLLSDIYFMYLFFMRGSSGGC